MRSAIPIDILISPDADQAERARAIASLGLDQPLLQPIRRRSCVQALQGNLGRSFVFNEPALSLIAERLPATLELAFAALLLALRALGLPAGALCRAATGHSTRGPPDRWPAASWGSRLPTFWVGLMLIMLFAV